MTVFHAKRLGQLVLAPLVKRVVDGAGNLPSIELQLVLGRHRDSAQAAVVDRALREAELEVVRQRDACDLALGDAARRWSASLRG